MTTEKIINVGIIGAAGRMGMALIRCISRFPRLSLAGAVESGKNDALGEDVGLIAGVGTTGVKVSPHINEISERIDVLIDFSSPSASADNAIIAADLKIALVIGTTGLNQKQSAMIHKAAELVPVVWAPNMSKGVNLLFNLVEKAAGILRDYDIEIVETHHKRKKDAPSGTALRIVQAAAAGRNLDPKSDVIYGRQGQTGERPKAQIGVHAVRAGDVVGDHMIILASEEERLELTHRASSRDCFAMGALQAAEWIPSQNPGLYTMQNVLALSG